ncbi:PTS transporter subunit EIIC [Enterococcus sp. BWB1-3]|uniref:PTS transporter subunit EIIC n=1 Tax=Enterococcus sp. BWB1-3 TaxID=2787713 RepID=UPI003FA59FBC
MKNLELLLRLLVAKRIFAFVPPFIRGIYKDRLELYFCPTLNEFAAVPEVFNIALPEKFSNWLWKVYGYSMGFVGLLVTATTARCLANSMNRRLSDSDKQMNEISVMLASICGFLMLGANQIDGGVSTDYMGTKGLIASFIAAFLTVNIYKFCVRRDLIIRMPKEVPGTIT